MALTQTDLVREVIGELFSLGSGQSPSAEDVEWVEQRVDATLAEISELNIYYIADATDIPAAAFNQIVAYLVQVVAPKFGQPRDEAAQARAEGKLRTLQRIGRGKGGVLRLDPALLARRRGTLQW